MGRQNPFPHSPAEALFIGFAGRMGAGKTSAAMHLSSSYGFQYTRYSMVLENWLSPGVSDRSRLQEVGWSVMEGGLQTELNARLIAGLDRSQSAAIDGLRHMIDFEILSSNLGTGFHMVFIDAEERRRFERLRPKFPSRAEFEKADSRSVEREVETLRSSANVTISNGGSLADLHCNLDALIQKWLKEA